IAGMPIDGIRCGRTSMGAIALGAECNSIAAACKNERRQSNCSVSPATAEEALVTQARSRTLAVVDAMSLGAL
ncbi:hypothetical protein, partial [Phyllobacterium phragmitis]|uniref:hypothetical protein n=1 Tax=Phyllobacterium phragmitis TaxID=2670329 RepID=UPI001AEC92C0